MGICFHYELEVGSEKKRLTYDVFSLICTEQHILVHSLSRLWRWCQDRVCGHGSRGHIGEFNMGFMQRL